MLGERMDLASSRTIQVCSRPPAARYVAGAERDTKRVALPLVAEIEVNTRCNRRCGYCPVSKLPALPGNSFMPISLFEKIIADLKEFAFDGRLSYHLYNEPLLRKDLERLVAHARDALPLAQQVLYTNGDLLSDARYAALIRAGVRSFVVTRHDSDAFPERPHQVVLTAEDLQITNRGGVIYRIDESLSLPCHAPEEMLIVTATGDVLLCYEDALRQNGFGNVRTDSLLAIWTSDRFVAARRALAAGRRRAAICRACNNRAHVEPGSSWFAL